MNILILGSGGREHALAWKIKQSPKCDQLFLAPGNGGTEKIATNLNINLKNFDEVQKAVKEKKIDLLVIGPEDPLVNGIVDFLKKDTSLEALKIVGPKAEGARLEGSKEYAKTFMNKHKIPTASAKTVTKENLEESITYLETIKPPYVLKANGLAAGKGVIITKELDEAQNALRHLIEDKQFGKASEKVLIEEFLDGIEVSFFVLTDGEEYQILPEAKDYKRIGENDTGLNTGGMGAISPVIFADKLFKEKVEQRIIKPTIAGLKDDKIDFCGFIFFGLISVGNEPYVIEYNVRLGDPEAEVVLPRIKSDFLELLEATADGKLADCKMEFEDFTSSTVMLVSGGYPEAYEKGFEINVKDTGTATLFHAGTGIKNEKLVTNGGRVIALTGTGKNMTEALTKAYLAAEEVTWRGKNYRKDIGFDLKALGQ